MAGPTQELWLTAYYAICFTNKDEDNIRCECLADTARVNGDRNFWSEVKKIPSRNWLKLKQ